MNVIPLLFKFNKIISEIITIYRKEFCERIETLMSHTENLFMNLDNLNRFGLDLRVCPSCDRASGRRPPKKRQRSEVALYYATRPKRLSPHFGYRAQPP